MPSNEHVLIIFGICGLKLTFVQAFSCAYSLKTGSLILRESYPRTIPLSNETVKLCSKVGCHAADSISL